MNDHSLCFSGVRRKSSPCVLTALLPYSGQCGQRLTQGPAGVCDNPQCLASTDPATSSPPVKEQFEVAVNLSDHTGTVSNFRLTDKCAEAMIGCTVRDSILSLVAAETSVSGRVTSRECARASLHMIILLGVNVEPWPNGTPNSSQLEPSYKIKTCIGGWPNGTSQVELARKKTIQFSDYDCAVTQQYNLARVGRSSQTVENLARVGRKFKFAKLQAHSIELEPNGWPNDTQLHSS